MAQPTEYELARAQRMAENRRKMEAMGLVDASRGLTEVAAAAPPLQAGAERAPRLKKRRAPEPEPASLEPTRLSRRLRGVAALSAEAAAAAGLAEAEAEGMARRATVRKQLTLVEGQQLAAPFTLRSIGVTVWELGLLHRGAWAHRYWSSAGCLFHHAYPVGYRASKVVFGRTYEMRIGEGASGPLFKVIDQQSGSVFSGESPTKPWTDVCIAQRTGQRISGPLFFGFSDPLTQRAIAVNLYTPAELAAALRGERVAAAELSLEEQVAQELCSLEGIGEDIALVLARTTELGGSRHDSLDALRGWASSSDSNAQALFDFLSSSLEVPGATRRRPAWRQRLVPSLVLALSGRQLGGSSTSSSPVASEAAADRSPDGGSDAAGKGSRGGLSDGQQRQQRPAAGHAAGSGSVSVAHASADQQEAAEAPSLVPARQPQQQAWEYEAWQQQALNPSQHAQRSTAFPIGGILAKENQQPAAETAGVAAKAPPQATAPLQRGGSVRRRKANSQLSEYLMELE